MALFFQEKSASWWSLLAFAIRGEAFVARRTKNGNQVQSAVVAHPSASVSCNKSGRKRSMGRLQTLAVRLVTQGRHRPALDALRSVLEAATC